jgi:Cu/Ag efflux protein CusF
MQLRAIIAGSALLGFAFHAAGAAEETTTPAAPKPPLAAGPLQNLDLARNLITLATKDGPQTFRLDERTFIFRGKEKITAEQLASGEMVKLRFVTNTTEYATARVLKVRPATVPSASP